MVAGGCGEHIPLAGSPVAPPNGGMVQRPVVDQPRCPLEKSMVKTRLPQDNQVATNPVTAPGLVAQERNLGALSMDAQSAPP